MPVQWCRWSMSAQRTALTKSPAAVETKVTKRKPPTVGAVVGEAASQVATAGTNGRSPYRTTKPGSRYAMRSPKLSEDTCFTGAGEGAALAGFCGEPLGSG